MYPVIVLVLISAQKGLEGTTFIDSSQVTNTDLEFKAAPNKYDSNLARRIQKSTDTNVTRTAQPYRLELRSFGTLNLMQDRTSVIDIS